MGAIEKSLFSACPFIDSMAAKNMPTPTLDFNSTCPVYNSREIHIKFCRDLFWTLPVAASWNSAQPVSLIWMRAPQTRRRRAEQALPFPDGRSPAILHSESKLVFCARPASTRSDTREQITGTKDEDRAR